MFSPNYDWMTTTGYDLLAQRIMLRLRMRRGSWIFDESKTLGGNLDMALRMTMPNALEELDTLVLEALEPIADEITLIETQVKPSDSDSRAVELVITYERTLPPEQSNTPILENQSLVLTLPIVT